jgi:Uma2 family endonuclease
MAVMLPRMTLKQFLKLPEAEPALEFHDGVVSQKMSPKLLHGTSQFAVATLINQFTWPRRLARVFTETRATFGGSSFVPDVIIYRWERVPADAHGNLPEDCREPPDIAVEIASPGQSLVDLANRCRWYVENGVQVAILLNPRTRSARAFRPGGNEATYSRTAQIDLTDVIPGFHLDLSELFSWFRARPE